MGKGGVRTCACACGCCCCMGVCCCCCVRACVRACGCCVCVRACVCVCVQVDETIRLKARGQVGWFLDLSVPSTAQSPQDEQTFFFLYSPHQGEQKVIKSRARCEGSVVRSRITRLSTNYNFLRTDRRAVQSGTAARSYRYLTDGLTTRYCP